MYFSFLMYAQKFSHLDIEIRKEIRFKVTY